jgi:hypothetical protein
MIKLAIPPAPMVAVIRYWLSEVPIISSLETLQTSSAIESRRFGFQCKGANHPLRVGLGLKIVAFAHVNAREGAR